MIHYSAAFLSRSLLVLLFGASLLLLPGCAQKIPTEYGDISDRVWLRTSADPGGVEGFFTGRGGQLLLVSDLPMDGLSWEMKDDHLLLWLLTQDQLTLQSFKYIPLLIEGRMILSETLSEQSPAYVAETPQEPLSKVDYLPIYLKGSLAKSPDEDGRVVYLQLDTSDSSLRGFAGVNNFYGSYQRKGAVGFEAGPMATTMMTGPRMDYEINLMNCLDQAEAVLSLDKRLFFYQDARLLCVFSAD